MKRDEMIKLALKMLFNYNDTWRPARAYNFQNSCIIYKYTFICGT